MHHSDALRREPAGAKLLEAVVSDSPDALPHRLRALRPYAEKLTRRPSSMTEQDVRALSDAGLSPAEIIDANQVVSYFNYVNRVAEGLGVELESSWDDDARAHAAAALGRAVTPPDGPDATSSR